jgi:hypothetical protein
MSRVKVIKKQSLDPEIVDMFNQMLGTGDADVDIIRPKYLLVQDKIKTIKKLLDDATENVFVKIVPADCKDINAYTQTLTEIPFVDVTAMDSKELTPLYNDLKVNNTVRSVILLCKMLIEHHGKLATDSTFDGNYINRMPGHELLIFPFSKLNIKYIWGLPGTTDQLKKYIFTFMRILLETTRAVYHAVTSPDVDIKKISAAIMNSIQSVKKQIPRCEKAFAKIQQSLDLLENNFDGYYKDFIQAQNPSTLIESYVIDVSRTGNTDPQTTQQFRKIINYFRKATQGKIKDPKIKKIFDMLNSNFN